MSGGRRLTATEAAARRERLYAWESRKRVEGRSNETPVEPTEVGAVRELAGPSAADAGVVWGRVLSELQQRQRVSAQSYATWFPPTKALGLQGSRLIVGVPNVVFQRWFSGEGARPVAEAVEALGLGGLSIEYVSADQEARQSATQRQAETVPAELGDAPAVGRGVRFFRLLRAVRASGLDAEVRLLLVMVGARERGGWCRDGAETLAADCGFSGRAWTRWVARAIAAGTLEQKRHRWGKTWYRVSIARNVE